MAFRATCLTTFAFICVACLAVCLPTTGAKAATMPARATTGGDWPQWRGPNRDAHVPAGAAWPRSLAHLSEVWRVPLGPGYSGPIVVGDRVIVTETEDKKREVVRALERATGKELWRAAWEGAMSVPFFAKANGDWIRSTPACDGESVFVGGMRDVLVSLDLKDGSERWCVDFCAQAETPVPAFGFVSSPLIVGDHLVVQAGGGFAKLEKATGKIVWKILEDGGGMNSAFSSPTLATLAGRRQILVQTRQNLVGVDPEHGDILWQQPVPAFRGMNILTPTVIGDGILTSTYKNRTYFYRVTAPGDGFAVKEAWNLRGQGYMSSPVVIDGFAYLPLGNGRLCCIDPRKGEELWRTKSFGKYWSMAANGKQVLALDERGELLLIEADPAEFRLLDRKKVSEHDCWAHVAVSGDLVFVRDLAGVSCFRWAAGAGGE
jgi:outer membrane protein assembly factor BamB